MNWDTYCDEMRRTTTPGKPLSAQLYAAALGLCGETGELADLVKKFIHHRHNFPKEKFVEELGDWWWYATFLMDTLGITLATIYDDYEMFDPHAPFPVAESSYDALEDVVLELFRHVANIATEINLSQKYAGKTQPTRVYSPLRWAMKRVVWLSGYCDISMSAVWEANVAKLRKRYPDGFSTEASLRRADETPAKEPAKGEQP